MDEAEFKKAIDEALAKEPPIRWPLNVDGVMGLELASAMLGALADRLGGRFASDVRGRLSLRAEKVAINQSDEYADEASDIIRDLASNDEFWTRFQSVTD